MLLKLLERIDLQRFSPHVFSLSTLGEVGPRIQALGIPVEALCMSPGIPPRPWVFYRLVQRLKVLRPDVVHTWLYHADLFGGLAARLAGVPVVVWCIRNSNLDKDKTKLTTRILAFACAALSRRLPNLILTCSEVAKQMHIDIGYAMNKMMVIPNGFDLSSFKPNPVARSSVRALLGLTKDEILVGLIARYDPLKNHIGFCQAAGLLRKRLPSVHFIMAGEGINSDNSELIQALRVNDVHSVTHLLGLRSDTPRLMAALDVLASSSYGEAFPNVLGEAMASGVPCVVTDVGDSAYIVSDTGGIVRPGDMIGLAKTLYEFLTLPVDERMALSRQARSRVEECFEIGGVVRQYEALYEKLLFDWRKF